MRGGPPSRPRAATLGGPAHRCYFFLPFLPFLPFFFPFFFAIGDSSRRWMLSVQYCNELTLCHSRRRAPRDST